MELVKSVYVIALWYQTLEECNDEWNFVQDSAACTEIQCLIIRFLNLVLEFVQTSLHLSSVYNCMETKWHLPNFFGFLKRVAEGPDLAETATYSLYVMQLTGTKCGCVLCWAGCDEFWQKLKYKTVKQKTKYSKKNGSLGKGLLNSI